MKLQAKARPVQINKLKLGGIEINTKDDLLQNFYLNEIINLGDKFTQWIRRHGEMHVYSEQVDSIIKVRNNEKVALGLLALFYPTLKNKTLIEVLDEWHENKTNQRLLKSLLSCIGYSSSTAIELITKLGYNLWLNDWLESCTSHVYLSSDFCYYLGIYFKNIDKYKSIKWLNEADERGSKEAKKILNELLIKNINIEGQTLTLVRVLTSVDDFYILKTVIPNSIFSIIGSDDILNNSDSRSRQICDKMIKKLREMTGLDWNYPSLEKWNLAFNSNIIEPPLSNCGEWCLNSHIKDMSVFCVANSTVTWKKSSDKCCLRPILSIKDNPQLA